MFTKMEWLFFEFYSYLVLSMVRYLNTHEFQNSSVHFIQEWFRLPKNMFNCMENHICRMNVLLNSLLIVQSLQHKKMEATKNSIINPHRDSFKIHIEKSSDESVHPNASYFFVFHWLIYFSRFRIKVFSNCSCKCGYLKLNSIKKILSRLLHNRFSNSSSWAIRLRQNEFKLLPC